MGEDTEVSNRVSVIGITISCSATEGSEGLDGAPDTDEPSPKTERKGRTGGAKRTGPKSSVPWFIWISFQLPGGKPVQLEVPMFGSDQTPEGERGDNNEEAAERIDQRLGDARASGDYGSGSAYDEISVSVQEADEAGGGRKDYYVRIVIPNAKSIDGGSNCPKIRVSGVAGNYPVGGSVGLTGPPKFRYKPAKIVPLPFPINQPEGRAPDGTFGCWPLPKKYQKGPKKSELRDMRDEAGEKVDKFMKSDGWTQI